MDKLFKYIIAVLIVCTLIGIFIALNMPRPKLTFSDKMKLSQIIAECNTDLPREIGTIGYLDSVSFADETVTYAVSVKGDDRIMQVYGAPDKPCGVGRADANPKLLLNDT